MSPVPGRTRRIDHTAGVAGAPLIAVDRLAAWRLGAARVAAWALLLSAWLSLGELGARHLSLWAGGMLPLALWLLAITLSLQAVRLHPPGRRALRLGLPGLALACAALLQAAQQGHAAALLALALGWAGLLVLASHTVRALRRAGPTAGRPGGPWLATPIVPACLGAALAWLVHAGAATAGLNELDDLAGGALILLAGTCLAALLPPGMPASGVCRAGLFDCSLPVFGLGGAAPAEPGQTGRTGRHDAAAGGPLAAARLLMLPMMASLPVMAPWCGVGGLAPWLLAALHLAAMLLPGLLLVAWLAASGALANAVADAEGAAPAGAGMPAAVRSVLRSLMRPGVRPGVRPGMAQSAAGAAAAASSGHAPSRLVLAVCACLATGVVAWALLPAGLDLLTMALCHGVAWSLAWAGPMCQRAQVGPGLAVSIAPRLPTVTPTPQTLAARRSALSRCLRLISPGLAPLLLIVLGLGVSTWGPVALVALHLALALWALAGLWLTVCLDLWQTLGNPAAAVPAPAAAAGTACVPAPASPPSDEPSCGRGIASAPTWRVDLP